MDKGEEQSIPPTSLECGELPYHQSGFSDAQLEETVVNMDVSAMTFTAIVF
jgi:hypothetical protein